MAKKVLIITYYWPPAGGPGVQRVLKFAKYLPEFGWEPIILTIDKGDYHATDNSLIDDIPVSVKVYKAQSFTILDFYKKLIGGNKKISSFELTKIGGGLKFKVIKWIRANLFIPDARKGWNRSAIRAGLKIIHEEKPELIFVSSPPHSLQLIGLKLAKKTGLKWVADFRDPWTDAFWDKELPRIRIMKKTNLRLEQRIVSSADSLISIGIGVIELLKKNLKVQFNLIPNGFDENDFDLRQKSKIDKFRITYIGSISNMQNPINFFKSVDNLPIHIKTLLEINFYGSFDQEVIKSSEEFGSNVIFNSYIPHNKAIDKMVNSELLLLLIPENSKGILTGKLFEYIATRNFILGIAPENNEVDPVLKKCNCGITYTYDDNLDNILIVQFDNWRKNKQINVNINEIRKYSRKNLSLHLAKILDNTIK